MDEKFPAVAESTRPLRSNAFGGGRLLRRRAARVPTGTVHALNGELTFCGKPKAQFQALDSWFGSGDYRLNCQECKDRIAAL